MFRYNINPDSEIPVYRQLVDQINAQIRSGALPTGAQLPTVREMAEQTHLSCGTIKRVYDCLREMGDIEMTRRRGSFVKYVRENRDSRKLQAMTAIDRMIRQLSDLNFSPSEIQIFLNLKMREWGLKWSGIRIALVTEYGEYAPAFERQLAAIGNVHVIICTPRQLREYPYSIDEQADVILLGRDDAQQLSNVLPDRSKLLRVAFRVKNESVAALVRVRKKRMGVLCEERALAELVTANLPGKQREALSVVCGDARELPEVLIVPTDWERLCSQELIDLVKGCELISFEYEIDEGSMIYLEERINRIRDERQLQPGVFGF